MALFIPKATFHTASRATVTVVLVAGLVALRFYSANNMIIPDCDEVFNYYEPLNLLVRGFGKITWEYSPVYAIRSWSFLVPLAALMQFPHTNGFYFTRYVLALASVLLELALFTALNESLSASLSYWFLLYQLLAPGMAHAAISLLPSTAAMVWVLVATTAVVRFVQLPPSVTRTSPATKTHWGLAAVAAFAAAGLFGWPFALVLAVPFLVYVVLITLFRAGTTDHKSHHTHWGWLYLLRLGFRSAGVVLVMVGAIMAVDAYLYRFDALTFVPLNIVLYNVFNTSETSGPHIFGVEPLLYYFLNLLLNFNGIALLAVLGLGMNVASLVFFGFSKRQTNLVTLTTTAPVLIWCACFFPQPHKEERFLYPIYPLLSLSAALATRYVMAGVARVVEAARVPRVVGRAVRVLAVVVLGGAVATVSVLRITNLVVNYAAPLAVYAHIPPAAAPVNVCVGREWYHYPSSFFLPENARLRFVRSGFDGLLPGDFKEPGAASGDVWGHLRALADAVSSVPLGMNNENQFDPLKVVPMAECDYYVDLSQAVAETEASVVLGDNRYADGWHGVHCERFIDSAHSSGLARFLYVPNGWGGSVAYFDYCLAQRNEPQSDV